MSKIILSHKEARNISDEIEPVDSGSWRWGATHSYVFERDGKNYMMTLRYHVEEGCQDEGDVPAFEVVSVPITTTVWRRVPCPAVAPAA